MLTMSCNQIYFQTLLGAVRDTWGKPLLQNKYENISWWSYTSCDEKHPRPVIDFENHMIYVDEKDDIYSTYTKTQKAYNMIKSTGIEFDYVIRTNTSVFVNIDNLLSKIESIDMDDILTSRTSRYIDTIGNVSFDIEVLIGYFIGMKREYFDIAMSNPSNYFILDDKIPIPTIDDVLMSICLYNNGLFEKTICVHDNFIIPVYKGHKDGEEPRRMIEIDKKDLFYKPECVNDYVVIRIRTFYEDFERTEKGHEIEHMYELYNALK